MRLQREPDITALPPPLPANWPAFLAAGGKNAAVAAKVERKLEDFHRSADAGYAQSHPYDMMFTGPALAIDSLALDNNAMKIIFGGGPGPLDNIEMAYDHSLRQMAEAPIERDSLLGQQNPLAFVPVGEASKDSLLETFAQQRDFYKGALDTDAERALKTRPTHRLIETTFYGKRLAADGSSLRYNHVRGQNDLLWRPRNLQDFRPFENLSSKTFAPDGEGGEVPLSATAVYDTDPRDVPVPGVDGPGVGAPPAVVGETDFTDFGMYAGQNADAFAPVPDTANRGFGIQALFAETQRRM
jgi:hypothetical protein